MRMCFLITILYLRLCLLGIAFSCEIRTAMVTLSKSGCESRLVETNLCFGGCNSISRPRIFPNKKNASSSTDICNTCIPGSYETLKVTLTCKNRKKAIRVKTLRKFTSCICKKVDCIR